MDTGDFRRKPEFSTSLLVLVSLLHDSLEEGVISAFGPNFRGLSHSAGFRLGINDNLCSFGLMTHAWVSSSFQGQVSCQGEKGWEVNKDLSKVTRLRCG